MTIPNNKNSSNNFNSFKIMFQNNQRKFCRGMNQEGEKCEDQKEERS